MKKLFFITCYLLLATCYLLPALDFGLLFINEAEYVTAEEEDNFEYQGSIAPRVSFPIGANGEIFVSGSFSVGYGEEEFYFYPELLRTEYNMRQGCLGLKIGRINYIDQTGYIAKGFFDGFQLSYSTPSGRFSLAGLYSGFIFKKSSYITMTAFDQEQYDLELDYGHFSDTYFGSRRVLAAIEYEHPSVGESLSFKTSLLAQFDINNKDEKINSQYITIKAGLPLNMFFFEAGGTFSTMQIEIKEAGEKDSAFRMAFAFDLGAAWIMPTSFHSRLSAFGHYTSGNENEDLGPFAPINTIYIGNIIQAKRTALTAISLDYSARIIEQLGLGVTASYFIRNDLVSGRFAVEGEEKEEFLLGPEFYAGVVWSPVSDLQINFGAGVFVPSLGNTWPDAKPVFKVDLTAVLAIF